MSEPSTQPQPAPQPAPERTFQVAEQSFHKTVQARATQRSAPAPGAGVLDSRPVQLQALELAGFSVPASAQVPPSPPREQSADVQQRKASPATEAWLGRALSMPEQAEPETERIQALAEEGTRGPGGQLPYLDQIQAAFGDHDVTGVEAHVGGEGGEAARAMGAEAFATGNDVAFDGEPTLHTAAHEAAHIVQQREGVQLKGGVGEVGDAYEQHADAVADAVVRGDSAQGLLDQTPAAAGGGAGTQKKASPAAPAKHAVQASPADPAVQLQGPPPPEGEDAEPPSEEEIDQMVRDARTEGETKGDAVTEAEPPGEPAAPPSPQPTGEPTQATQPVTANPDRTGTFAATPPAPGAELPAFQSLKSGPLSKWDDEVAWHEYFQGGGGLSGPGAPITVDRDALIRDAMLGGAGEGVVAGLKTLAIDTAINIASSRIPYLQGFVEMAKIAYDPKAWLEGTVQGTWGNMANGGAMFWEGVTSGDPIGALDGLLTILDGINNVIGTLSTICWIVAAASFVLSFICPAALPFASLAASWASTLGLVSTAFGLYLTLGRALVIALRALQIKFGDADPATLLKQGERLRTQTKQFSQAVTTQAGNRLRQTAQQRLQARGQARNGTQPAAQQSTATAQPATRMQRVMNFLNGGMDVRQTTRDARDALGRSSRGTQAWAGRGQYAQDPYGGQTPRSRQQQVADMEHAGLTVHHNDASRTRFNQRVGGAPGVNRELAQQQQNAARTLRAAAEADEAAQTRLRQAQEAADQARQERQRLENDPDTQQRIRTTREAHEANQRLLTEAQRNLETKEYVVGVLRERRAEAAARGDHPENLMIMDQHILKAQMQVYDARDQVSHARVAVATSNVDRLRAQMPVTGAQNLDQQAQGNLENARTQAGQATTTRDQAREGLIAANSPQNEHARTGGMTLNQTREAAERSDLQRDRWYFDFTGTGPTDLHGHNKGAGVTGAGVDLVNNAANGVMGGTTDEKGNDKPGFLGVWQRTNDGQPLDTRGTSGDRSGADSYQGRVQARLDALKTTLKAPPEIAAPIDDARAKHADLDLESRQIAFQQEVMASLLDESAQSMTALEAMQQISAANQEAVAQHQGQLDEKTVAQESLRTEAERTATEAEKGEKEGAGTAKTVGGFMSRFLDMLNLVPGRLIGGAGDGAGGIRSVATSAEDQKKTAGDAKAGAKHGVTEAERMTTETSTALTEADADAQTLAGVDAQLTEEQLATMDGQLMLQESLAAAAERQIAIEEEMNRLRESHEQAVNDGAGWATTHEQDRLAGLRDLDGLVELAERPPGGGGGQ